MQTNRAPGWLDPVMRAGYGARSAVYLIVGGLAAAAAILQSTQAEGTGGALRTVARQDWGAALLVLVGFGLALYALWRWLDAALDLESYGTDAKGAVARIGMLVTGIVHLALGIYCYVLVFGTRSGSGGNSTQGATAWLLAQPWGRWAVIAVGVAVIGAGLYYINKGLSGKYRRGMKANEVTSTLDPAMKGGVIAHGIVVVMIGCFLFWAGWTHDASEAGGLNKAFQELREAPYGRVLLAAAALGLLGFATFCLMVSIYGIVPRVASPDTPTMTGSTVGDVSRRAQQAAQKAKQKATG